MNTPRIFADHRRLLCDGVPLIDLRAPAEFTQGAFPSAINLPLLTDAERAAVGTRYKECGQRSAIELGHSLVSGATRTARIDAWRAFIATRPNALLYCWRGGLRSQIAQEWLLGAGVDIARIAGGYKALRRACIDATSEFSVPSRLLVIGGRTGSGKTELLNEFSRSIDLERLANHRGSAFGATFTPQPMPVAFENELAIEMLRRIAHPRVLLEDESRTIGRLALPEILHDALQTAPLVVLDIGRDERAMRIYQEYVEAPLSLGVPSTQLQERFGAAVDRIRRRLGAVRHAEVRGTIEAAFSVGRIGSDAHLVWIERLLEWYYDPMYEHQLTAKHSRILLTGDRKTVRAFLTKTLA